MAREDIAMSKKERKKLHFIQNILEKRMMQCEVAKILGISDRQVRTIVKRVKEEGEGGIVHRLKGRRSNRAHDEKIQRRILKLYAKKYHDFGPLLASEKLFEIDKIEINDETLRLWLKNAGMWQGRRKGRHHRKWRERKHYVGEMVQMDGSHHDWLEGRGPELVLMGYIDDATGTVYARFYDYEGTMPALDSFKGYIQKYGLPQCLYFDKHTTYKSTKKPSIEDELMNREALTHFGRALRELGVDFNNAHSPQAKGRIERLFRTFQDRVIKEMRLLKIKTKEQANKFLEDYLPCFNERFSVIPIEKGNLHQPLAKHIRLDGILCKKTQHPLRNDYTVIHNGHVYQVLDKTKALSVIVEERLNGRMYITYKGEPLKYKEIPRQLFSLPRARYSQKEKEAKRKIKGKKPMRLWKLMDNSSSYPQLPQYYGY